ncbi:MAG: hypothetical protein ABSA05_10260 [Opitutaceae bacterium]
MLRALFYLRFESLLNRIAAGAARLRQPKYFAAALVGAAYVYYFMLRPMTASWQPAQSRGIQQPYYAHSFVFQFQAFSQSSASIGGAVVLFLFLLFQAFFWISPPAQPGLRFSEAEIAFLFPAPFTRRRLVHFNLISSQIRILVSSVILAALFNRWHGGAAGALGRAIGWWIIFSTFSMNSKAFGLAVAKSLARAARPGLIRFVALSAVGAVAAIAVVSIASHAHPPAFGPNAGPSEIAGYLDRSVDVGLLHWLLWPFRWVVGPYLAGNLRAFALALGPALLIPAGLYAWIVRMEVPFEEGSIALSEKQAEIRAAWKAGRRYRGAKEERAVRRDPFRLGSRGRPEAAFFWKNLLAIQSWFNLRLALIVLATTAVFASTGNFGGSKGSGEGYAEIVLACALFAGGYTLFLGPQLLRQDLRSDLPNADILKTYPLAGWQIVLGELLTPAAILSGLLWLAILVSTWALGRLGNEGTPFEPVARIVGAACLAALVPPLCALQLLIPNAAAVIFPGWFQSMRTRGGGIETMGQRLIFVFGQLIAVAIAILPAALLAAGVFIAGRFYLGFLAQEGVATVVALIPAAATLFAILAGELWCGLWWLGRRFERLDLSREIHG